jgi:HSP20 family molecular chaperone IbpA
MANEIRTQNDTRDVASSRRQNEVAYAPPVDVYENKEEFLLIVDMPGVAKNDIEIHLDKGQLLLTGKVTEEAAKNRKLPEHAHRALFRRAFSVPQGIDGEHVSAELRQGVLSVRLPKSAALKPRQIQVRGD